VIKWHVRAAAGTEVRAVWPELSQALRLQDTQRLLIQEEADLVHRQHKQID
jgi:hypothetical protein